MIKINLLPARKPKRQSEPGQRDLMVGLLALILIGGAVFFLVDKPRRDDLAKLNKSNEDFQGEQARRKDKIKGLAEMRTTVAESSARADSINKLIDARAVPAHMLHELGEIMTPGRMPTMTKEMSAKVKTDPNYMFHDDWDPKHIWITELTETKGAFEMTGGAESDADVTQLAKRLQASAYFLEITPTGGEKVTDRESGITYYSWTIKGKVVY